MNCSRYTTENPCIYRHGDSNPGTNPARSGSQRSLFRNRSPRLFWVNRTTENVLQTGARGSADRRRGTHLTEPFCPTWGSRLAFGSPTA